MHHKKTKQPAESKNTRRVVRTSELRSSQYTYHGDRRERAETANNTSRQMRRPEEHASRGQAQQARGSNLARMVWRRRFVYSALGLGVIVLVNILLYSQTSPVVELVKGYEQQQTLRQNQVYEQEAAKYLNKSLANHNKITIDGEGLERHMKQTFPELQLIQLTVPAFGSRPVLVIQPSRPLVLLQTATSGTYVVDESGYAIATAETFKGSDLPVVVDQTALTVLLGSQVLPKSSMRFMSTVLAQYAARQLTVESLILPQSAYELDVRTSGDNYYVKYSMITNDSALQQIGSYFSMREYLIGKQAQPREYVDVRTNGRAYYK